MKLEERLQRLEDDRAIRDLKARYLRACDSQDVATVSDCLAPDARIDFEGFPPFSNRDDFVAVYRQFGCVPGVHDIHHAANGIVTFESDVRAIAKWSLLFHNVNLAQRTLTQFGVEYDDVYIKHGDRWQIAETRSRRKSCVIERVDAEGHATVIAMGEAPAVFGDA